METSRYGKKDIKAIAKMDECLDAFGDANFEFMVEVWKYTSSKNNVYSKINFYNMNGADKKMEYRCSAQKR